MNNITTVKLGTAGELLAKSLFLVNGFDVKTIDADDHGVDFEAEKNGINYKVQVKAITGKNYQYISKNKIEIDDKFIVCYIRYNKDIWPEVYIFPSTVWLNPNKAFVDKNYDKPGQNSKPEYGINYSKNTVDILKQYVADNFFNDRV